MILQIFQFVIRNADFYLFTNDSNQHIVIGFYNYPTRSSIGQPKDVCQRDDFHERCLFPLERQDGRNASSMFSISPLEIPDLPAIWRQCPTAPETWPMICSRFSLPTLNCSATSRARSTSRVLLCSEILRVSPVDRGVGFMSKAGDNRHPFGVRRKP